VLTLDPEVDVTNRTEKQN